MVRAYSVQGAAAVGTNLTILGVTATTAVRPSIYELNVGCGATPADQAGVFRLARYTAAGTSTSVTPKPIDPANPACVSTSGYNHTVEPTYTSGEVMLAFPLNQRATFRWVAVPGSEFIAPATAANGLGFYSLSNTGTASHTAHFLFTE